MLLDFCILPSLVADSLEREYARLLIDYLKRRRYGALAATFALIIYALMGTSPLVTLLGGATNFLATSLLGFALLMSIILLAIFWIKARMRKFTGQQVTAIKTYNAYVKISRFFEEGLHERHKRAVKKAIRELVLDFQAWKGKKTPPFMAKPADDVIKALKEKALTAIDSNNQQDVENVKLALRELLTALHGEITKENLDIAISRLNVLPPPMKLLVTETWDLKPKFNWVRFITQRRVVVSIYIFLPFIVGAFLLYYALPFIYADSEQKPTIDTQVNGFLGVIIAGIAAVVAYLAAHYVLKKP